MKSIKTRIITRLLSASLCTALILGCSNPTFGVYREPTSDTYLYIIYQ